MCFFLRFFDVQTGHLFKIIKNIFFYILPILLFYFNFNQKNEATIFVLLSHWYVLFKIRPKKNVAVKFQNLIVGFKPNSIWTKTEILVNFKIWCTFKYTNRVKGFNVSTSSTKSKMSSSNPGLISNGLYRVQSTFKKKYR
jgi:hypothetical protein